MHDVISVAEPSFGWNAFMIDPGLPVRTHASSQKARALQSSATGGLFAAALAFALALAPTSLVAQYDAAPPPSAWAMSGVTITHADGRVESGVTVVVRGGMIQTLRAGAPIPADAQDVTWADGTLYLYPGIVDAHGAVAVELPTPNRDGTQTWNPTREIQFFTPHREAASFLRATGSSLASERRRGVVASAVFPGRGILPGQPSLIVHRVDARTSAELVMTPSLGLAAAWQGAQGAYPGTLMAQHAFLRQAFADAEHYRLHRAAQARDTQRMATVTHDADYEWLNRAAAREVPVFFQASGAEDIRRVLSLADELRFRPILVGASEAGAVSDALARRSIPVLLNAGFPQPQNWRPGDDETPLTPAAARERVRLQPVYETPARLAAAGVTFAFTSGGAAGTDLLRGARRAIEFGLSEADALRALTLTPATLLGVAPMVRIGEGLPATFMVTDRPLFQEDARIVWTFVNGHPEKGQDPTGPRAEAPAERTLAAGAGAAAASGDAGFAGTWTGDLSAGPQSFPLAVRFDESDGGLRGTVVSGEGAEGASLSNVTVDGVRISFGLALPQAAGAVANLNGIRSGDQVTGTGTLQFGDTSFPFTFELRRAPGGALR
jgi:imidazolonepropionase-like amidohydrolase